MHGMKIISVDASAAGANCFHEKYAQDKIWNANIFGQSSAVHFRSRVKIWKNCHRGVSLFWPQLEPAPHTRAPIVLSDGNLSPQNWKAFLYKRAEHGEVIRFQIFLLGSHWPVVRFSLLQIVQMIQASVLCKQAYVKNRKNCACLKLFNRFEQLGLSFSFQFSEKTFDN